MTQVYMTLTWTYSALKPQGQNCMDILKKSGKSKWWPCFSSSLMKRVLHLMRNPKLAHILVLYKSERFCSSRRAEKDAMLYLNSTMVRFRILGISRFQFWLILQICKGAIELPPRQKVLEHIGPIYSPFNLANVKIQKLTFFRVLNFTRIFLFFELSHQLNQVFNSMYCTMYSCIILYHTCVLLKQSTMGKPRF